MTSFEVRLISTMMWRSASSFSSNLRLILVHDVDAMADALCVSEIDSFANVEAKAIGRNEAGSDLACVQGDVYFRIDAVEIVEHQHLAVVLGHGQITRLQAGRS